MKATVNFLKFKETLTHSEFGLDLYSEYFKLDKSTFNSPLIDEVESLFNKIISEIPTITEAQVYVLNSIFSQFLIIQEVIDPNRLKDFFYIVNDDNDLILFRNNDNESINLIIHPEDDFSLSIIGKKTGNSLTYFDNDTADYEEIVYSFLR